MIQLGIGFWAGGLSPAANRTHARLIDDGYGGWRYAMSAIGYGLSDDGHGGWVWSDTPDYRLNASSHLWE